jgi:hypoxanthine phosphoribosyltransferase
MDSSTALTTTSTKFSEISKVILTEQQIQNRIQELGARISADYKGKDLLTIAVLRGAVIFHADLIRCLTIDVTVDFLSVSSYHSSTVSSGEVRVLKNVEQNLEGKNILLVEDIIDTGLTLRYLLNEIAQYNPASLKVCSLLSKPQRRKIDVPVDYLGFEIPDRFVVGFGMDLAEKYRNLPFIGILTDYD